MKKIISLALFLLFTLHGSAQAIELTKQKNINATFVFPMLYNNGTYATGAAGLDSEYSYLDSELGVPNSWTDCTDESAEIGSSGYYLLNLTGGEMNHQYVFVQVKTSTANATTQSFLIRTITGDPHNLSTVADLNVLNNTLVAMNTNVTTANTVIGQANTTVTNANVTITNANVTVTNVNITETAQNNTWTAALAGNLDFKVSTVNSNLTNLTAIESAQNTTWTAALAAYLDATISSRGTSTLTDQEVWEYATRALTDKVDFALTTAEKSNIANITWNVTLADHLGAGSTGYALNAAGAAGDPWSTALPGEYGAGTAGYIIGTNIDALISSRMATFSYTAPDNTGITNILTLASTINNTTTSFNTTWTPTKAGYLDDSITSRMATFSYTAPDNTNIVNTYNLLGSVDGNLTTVRVIANNINATETAQNLTWTPNLAAHLDADISSRMATFTYTAPDNVNITNINATVNSIKAKTDSLTFTTANKIDARAFVVDDKLNYTLQSGEYQNIANTTWGNTTRTLTAGTNIVLAKGVGITGFNDIAAADVWSVETKSLTDKANFTLTSAERALITDGVWNTTRTGHTGAGAFGFYLDAQVSTVGGGSLTVEDIVNGVWDELIANHTIANSTADTLNKMPTPYDIGP